MFRTKANSPKKETFVNSYLPFIIGTGLASRVFGGRSSRFVILADFLKILMLLRMKCIFRNMYIYFDRTV